ncbi:thiamine diphosphokinase [Ruminococcus albus]|uniref:Thiamine diphosphokinase n=1 Tax=Ruminococcus albus TaxID=1264 RepID=A0A1I1MPW7_RUMAL|nr:thiamine diphosphokinase [Ruminococcus albus]SFC87195.1 thiamine pyrophosphokinase [Ruminococcus albus]
MTDTCVIFAGGDPVKSETVDKAILENAFIICADKGYALAESLGVEADIVLGDFDSLNYTPSGDKVMCFPPEKDDTDLMLAVNRALEMGAKRIVIYGACGGRIDHMIGNIACLALIAENGANGTIVGDDDIISFHMPGEFSVPYKEGFSLSLFAYSREVKGLAISGAKYSVQDCTLTDSVTLGVSNEIIPPAAKISFTEGRLLVIQSRL